MAVNVCCAPENALLDKADMLISNAAEVADMVERLRARLFGSAPSDCCEKQAPPANLADKMKVCKGEIDRAGKSLSEMLGMV